MSELGIPPSIEPQGEKVPEEKKKVQAEPSLAALIPKKEEKAKSWPDELQARMPDSKMKERLRDYAFFTPESSETAPILKFFKTLFTKIARLLHIGPSRFERAEINASLLSGVLQASADSLDVPRSVALDYLKQYYKQKLAENPSDTESRAFVDSLETALSVSREIDRLQAQKSLRGEEGAFAGLIKMIEERLNGLEDGEKMIIPGGWHEGGEFHDGLYEIKKTQDTYSITFVSLDSALEPYVEKEKGEKKVKKAPYLLFENVKSESLKESLAPLIQLQLTQTTQDKAERKKGWLDRRLDIAQKLIAGDSKGASALALTPFTVMGHFYPKASTSPPPEGVFVDQDRPSNPINTFLTYVKLHAPERYTDIKFELEVKTFFDVVDESRNLLSHVGLRKQIEDASMRLLVRIEKSTLDEADKAPLVSHVYQVLGQVRQYTESAPARSVSDLSMKNTHVEAKLGTAIDLSKYGSNDAQGVLLEAHPFPVLKGNALPDFVSVVDIRVLELYDAGDFVMMERVLLDAIRQLPVPPDTRLQGVDEKKIYRLGQALFETFKNSQQKTVRSETVLAMGKVQAIYDSLQSAKPELKTYKNRVYFDPGPILDLIQKDTYFRLTDAELHHDALKVVAYWEQVAKDNPKGKVRFDDAYGFHIATWQQEPRDDAEREYTEAVGENERNFMWYQYRKKYPEGEAIDPMGLFREENEGQKEVVDALHDPRRLFIFGKILAYNGYNVHITDQLKVAQLGNQMISEAGGAIHEIDQKEIWRRGFVDEERAMRSELARVQPLDEKTQHRPYCELSIKDWQVTLTGSDLAYLPMRLHQRRQWCGKEEVFREDGKFLDEKTDKEVVQFSLAAENSEDGTHLVQPAVMRRKDAQDIKDLRLMQSDTKRLELTVAVFMQHPEYFKNPSYMRLFELNVFASGKLHHGLEHQPEFAKSFCDFIKSQYELCVNQKDVHGALIFLELGMKLKGFLDLATISSAISATLPGQDSFDKLRQMSKGDPQAEKERILHKLAALCKGARDATFKREELEEILASYFTLKRLPTDAKSRDPEIEASVARLMAYLEPQLQTMLRDPENLKNFCALLGVEIGEHKIKGSYPRFKIGDIRVDCRAGLVFSHGKAQGMLSDEIVADPQFLCLFSQNIDRRCTIEFRYDPVTSSEIVIYTLPDQPDIRLIQKRGEPLAIQKKIKEPSALSAKWYQLLETPDEATKRTNDKAADNFPPPAAHLLDPLLVFRDVTDNRHLILCDPVSQELLYTASFEKTEKGHRLEKLVRHADGAMLVSPWESEAKLLGQLPAIESQQNILVWAKGGKIKEVQYPRFKMGDGKPLTYLVRTSKMYGKEVEVFYSPKQFEGYELHLQRPPFGAAGVPVSDEVALSLSSILPATFDQFQLLVKAKSAGKVLIPLQELHKSDPEKKLPAKRLEKLSQWFNRTWFSHNPESTSSQKLLVFDVDLQARKLKSDSKEANAALAYIFFAHKHYETALEYLEKCQTARPMSEGQKNVFAWIQKWPDSSPRALSVKLKAAIMYQVHKATLEKASPSLEQEVLAVDQLMKLKAAYDAEEKDLPPTLKLTSREQDQYTSLTQASYLAIYPEGEKKALKEVEKPTPVPGVSQAVHKGMEHSDAAKQMWIHVGSREAVSRKGDLYLRSDVRFVKGFQDLYEKIYYATGDEFYKLVREVELAQPRNALAQNNKRYLLALIKAKREKADLEPLLFPKAWNQGRSVLDRLRLVRIAKLAMRSAEKKIALFADFLGKLDPYMEKVAEKEKKPPVAKKPQIQLSEGRELQRERDRVALEPEGAHRVFEAKTIIEEEEVENVAEAVSALERAQKLERLRVDRRVAELQGRRETSDLYLQTHPVKELPAATLQPPAPFEKPIFEFASTFDAFVVDATASKTSFDGLRAYAQGEGVAETTKRLATQYADDTQYFIDNVQEMRVDIKDRSQLAALQSKARGSYDEASKKRVEIEGKIIALLVATRSSLFAPGLSKVPDRLIGLYMEGKMDEIKQLYSIDFSDSEIQELTKWVEDFMLSSTQERLSKSLVDMIDNLPKKVSSEQAGELYALLNTKRYFDVASPVGRTLLAIEFINGYVLREIQVSKIQKMIAGHNLVCQVDLGGGKSSVLLPRLLKEYADGTMMALGVIPEWLYEIVSAELDVSCQALFGQKLYRFEFDRNSPISRESLLKKYVELSSAISNRDAVITTKTFLLSFKDKYVEMQDLYKENPTDELKEQLDLMGDILLLFKERARVIADEVDSILDVRQELNYALGLPEKLSSEKFKLGIDIYRTLVGWQQGKDTKLQEIAKKFLANEQAGLSDETRRYALAKLAEAFHDKLKLPVDLQKFIDYILMQENVDYPGVISKEHLQEIAFLRQFLGATLNSTLSLSNNTKYGRAKDGESTIPYKASMQPTEAEYGDSFERIAFYIQDYLQAGLSQQQVEAFIAQQRRLVELEMQEARLETGEVLPLEECETYKYFCAMYPGIDLVKGAKDSDEVIRLREMINKETDSKLAFLERFVFPNIEMANRQVSANGFDLVDMVFEFNGFSGTTWNIDTYHKKIDTSEASEPGVNGKSLEFLYDAYAKGELAIREVASGSLDEMMQMDDFWSRYDSIIDVGAYNKGVSNEEVAAKLGAALDAGVKRAVAYVKDEEKVLQDFGSEIASPMKERSDVPMSERISYYDEGHTIGTDIPHQLVARAAVTVGEGTYLKDLIQGIWRMRKLRRGQKIDFIIKKDVAALIKARRATNDPRKNDPEITIDDIINFCIDNQAKREADDNLRADRGRIASIAPQRMFWHIVKSKQPELFALFHDLLVKTTGDDLEAQTKVVTKKEAVTVLEEMKRDLSQKYEKRLDGVDDIEVRATLLAAIFELEDYQPLDENKLPAMAEPIGADSKNSQVQAQRQQQQQMSVRVAPKKEEVNLAERWDSWQVESVERLSKLAKHMPALSVVDPAIDSRITVSPNFVGAPSTQDPAVVREHLLSDEIKVAHVVVIKNTKTNEWQLVVVDILDYERVISPLLDPEKGHDFEAMCFDVRPEGKAFSLGSTAPANAALWQDEPEPKKLLAIAKLFAGQYSFYDKEERQALTLWLRTQDKERLRLLFERELLNPAEKDKYLASPLYKILTTLS